MSLSQCPPRRLTSHDVVADDEERFDRVLRSVETVYSHKIQTLQEEENITTGVIGKTIDGVIGRLHKDDPNPYGSVRILRNDEMLAVYNKSRGLWYVYKPCAWRAIPALRSSYFPTTLARHETVARMIVLSMVACPECAFRVDRSPAGHVYSASGKLFVCKDTK